MNSTQLLAEQKNVIGQIFLGTDFSLRHIEDRHVDVNQLRLYKTPEAAREVARYDKEGVYRPLKTAPNLRRGWLLQLKNEEQVCLALDFFYPAALDLYRAWLQAALQITPLRETLERQTGMYQVTRQLSEKGAQKLIGKMCCSKSGCLRKILWPLTADQTRNPLPLEKTAVDQTPPNEIPLLCREACNLLVAAAREVVKGEE
ncbi:MAG: hypothetical protein K2W99_05610 [Chthoniobacterales bacterium]|nr:hypothetical protein [Chthoniobacterales bacterium]